MSDETQINEQESEDELTVMLRGDQQLRWHQGQRVPVEAYFEHYPELVEKPSAVRQLILSEMRLCRELGVPLDLAELRRRFPRDDAWLVAEFERFSSSASSQE